ncbi:hypothetical protein SAY87_000501 [Trapa incisa]|uniref:Uncharacterized protein n=1 Tax=Trapa incisa TaxID=236973 RepID=A0AAN7GH03_9MYRT|nr:hypothetical protein SAY87_000501 [Trapa incisa]
METDQKDDLQDQKKHKEILEFKAPQLPSLGTNSWGGASPLLTQDIPKESLEQKYLRLNSIPTLDDIFPTQDDNFLILAGESSESDAQEPPVQEHMDDSGVTVAPAERKGLLSRLVMGHWREKPSAAHLETVTLGMKKKRWFVRLDPHHRWPQGWC